jgi:hypothetical protein
MELTKYKGATIEYKEDREEYYWMHPDYYDTFPDDGYESMTSLGDGYADSLQECIEAIDRLLINNI